MKNGIWKKEQPMAQGNLLVDMEFAEMPLPEVVAWIIDEGAIYYNGVLYYRK